MKTILKIEGELKVEGYQDLKPSTFYLPVYNNNFYNIYKIKKQKLEKILKEIVNA